MKPKLTAGILGASALLFGGVDASTLREQPFERTERIAGYDVKAEQIGNQVETTLPWKDQKGLKVIYDMGEPTVAEKVKDKRDKEVITEVVTDFDGGFKVDILLNEKPSTNRFCYTIDGAENYDFFYQPPLTAEEITEGTSRPPEIEGSYAVYHKTLRDHVIGKENYATGKVLHIPRPQVWELGDEANKVWADLSYDDGQLCVTAPQDFLDNADYKNGVRIDPTFGYTTIGATAALLAEDTVRVAESYIPSSGFVSSISVYMESGSPNNISWKGVIYKNSDDSLVGNGTGQTDEVSSNTFFTNNLNGEFISSTESYLIGFWFVSADFNSLSVRYDTNASINSLRDDLIYVSGATAPNNPFVTDATSASREYSLYATYTSLQNSVIRLNTGTLRINNGKLDI